MSSGRPPGRDPAAEQLRLMWRVAGMAFMVSAEVAAGAGLGWLVDRWAGTGQRWLTIGGIAGIVVGLTTFIRSAYQLSRSTRPADRDTDDPGPSDHDDA